MSDQEQGKKDAPALSIASHVLVAVAAAGLAVWVYGRATSPGDTPEGGPAPDAVTAADVPARASETDDPGPPPGPTAPADSAGNSESTASSESTVSSESTAPADPPPHAPVRIVADPEELRVWHNTRVTLRAEAAEAETFTRYVWHFEDGSDPEEGETVAHVFPESVADRHVTLRAFREGGDKLVVSRTLPIERLAVVPLDGEAPKIRPIPRARGTRLVFVGGAAAAAAVRGVVKRAAPVAAIVVVAEEVARIPEPPRDHSGPHVPVLVLSGRTFEFEGYLPGSAMPAAALEVRRGEDAVKKLIAGTAEVTVIGELALVVHDTRWLATPEAAIRRPIKALEAAGAYPASLLLTAKPLSGLTDGDRAAPSAFRLYEGAVRSKTAAVVSAASQVAYDARYGALEAVAIGRAPPPRPCRRLSRHDECQSATITVLDVPTRGRVRALHLRGPKFLTWLTAAELPTTVGKYRR